jgi:hypothetical protein
VSISQNEEPSVLHVFWQIQYQFCDWTLRVATANYTLHPNPFPANVPIAKSSEYNVTLNVMCDHEAPEKIINMNVSLSILLSDNVIEHVPYIMCSLLRVDTNNNMIHYHSSRKEYLQSYLHHDFMTSSTAITQGSTPSTQEKQSYYLTSNQSTQSFVSTIVSTRNEGITSSANNTSYEGMNTYCGVFFCLVTLILLCRSI